MPWVRTSAGSCGSARLTRFCTLHRVDVGIGADRKGDGQRVAAVVAAGRLHVDHLVDADDLRFDRLRYDGFDHLGTGARIARRDLRPAAERCRETARPESRQAPAAPANVMTMEMTTASRGRSMNMPESMAQAPGLTSVACTI